MNAVKRTANRRYYLKMGRTKDDDKPNLDVQATEKTRVAEVKHRSIFRRVKDRIVTAFRRVKDRIVTAFHRRAS